MMTAPAKAIPPPGSINGTGGTTSGSSGTSNRFIIMAGFVVAGGALLLLADVAPKFALGTAALIGLGVALTHTAEINSLVSTWRGAIGI